MIARAIAMALLTGACALILKELGWRGTPVLIAVCFIGIISLAEPYIRTVSRVLGILSEEFGVSDAASSVTKIIAIGYLGGITADVCCELGAGAASKGVLLVARLEILAICAPYLLKIINLATELIG